MNIKLKLRLLKEKFSISKLDINQPFPKWALADDWYSITKTNEEISIVCQEKYVPDHIISESGWRCFKIEGILDFGLIGILAHISTLMANGGISIFAISTYNTDYILIKDSKVAKAIEIFRNNDFEVLIDY